jgi:signal transduction histidine kinase/DNA-binding response OmpR family regulator/sugar lactone lactonase YvrE
VWSIFEDHQNNLWIGCQQKGLLMIPTIEPLFDTYSFSNQKQQIGTPVTAICKGDDGIVWCTVQGNGIYGFDLAGKIHSSHNAPKAVEMMYRDSKGKFWVTTDRALYVWQPTTDTYQQKAVFDCDKLNDMVDDRNGRLYLSTYSRGFAVYDTATGTFRSFSSSPSNSGKGSLHNNWIHKMFVDSSGLVWLATAAGVSCYHPVLDSFNSLGWNYLLDGTMCYALCETREGDMLIGTEQGLYTWHRQKNQVTKSPHAEVLCDKAVSYIAAESDGGIWCSTREGIWHYQPKQEKWVGYLRGNGLGSSDYVVAAGLQTDSTIYFGTADGITFLQPNRFKKSRSRLGRVYLTSFLIAGHRHATRGKTQFEIPYQTNSFTVDFSHFDFNNAENTVLEYRLNESPWTPLASGQNSISFNNLSSGVYNLEVRAVVNDQTSAVSNYTFIVTTPWYRTVYAYLGYAMLLGFIAAYLIKVYLREKRRQLENEKMKFLINTTHDIRSPLTLILSPLNKLKKKHAGAQGWEELELIEQNANKILALVNQILDMRKIDKQQMKLQCQETDIVGFVNSIYKMFAYNAKEHNINYTFHHPNDAVKAWIDHTQFDKVVSNLLSNAFKYTSDGGNIDVVVSNDDHFVRLSVTDDGIGIREDERKRVFDRFYQSAGSEAGTGIGLHLCKMIVDLHHGIIDVLAGYHGQGTTFEIRIPVGDQHLSADEIMPTIADATCGCRPNSQYRLLFVDDDIDLASFVVKELCRFYHIVHCINGREAMRKLNVEAYDIVVSDVMMPEMDGLTFLRTIKRNSMLNHLPVVLLTSQADVSNRLEGLEGGADGFLAKPFDIEELHTLIDNLLSNRLRLRGKFTGIQQQKVRVDKIELSSADDQLMERVMNAVNERISDSEFDVDALAHAVGLGRSQLYKRMKELTGLSVADFIRNIRLEQAARLIQENKVNISQVAYTVGFSSPAHFSTLFKRYFGVPPSEYVSKD